MFYLFVAILAGALLSAIGFIYFLIRKKKYGMKPLLISALVCVILVGIAIPMGKQPSVSFNEYKEQSSTFSYDSYLNDQVDVDTFVKIKGEVVTLDASIEGEENMFFLVTEAGQYYAKNNSGEEIKDGEILTFYGKYAGKRDAVTPAIRAQYFER
ncbi:hypothetical protein [Planococcus wigleyi]|uniref:DUF4131 domain-containing protein n=1 Tax=Planococcus wigleyi TaxID=2762216 RepID=A0ABR8WA18_9BACL|nr:hypothetical protein [Planococcus wigleyi]MBD8013877.1 hypothetical protein [Planococcus wigleyi]